jgi:hypothetical protein
MNRKHNTWAWFKRPIGLIILDILLVGVSLVMFMILVGAIEHAKIVL